MKPPYVKLLGRTTTGLTALLVDGQYVRDNLDIDFTAGGHGLVYPEYIPKDEIWIDSSLGDEERMYTLLHELHERGRMAEGAVYDFSHNDANQVEAMVRQKPAMLAGQLRQLGWNKVEQTQEAKYMMTAEQKLNEAKDLNAYKRLLTILNKWSEAYPMTGIDRMLEIAIAKGRAVLPKDKHALEIVTTLIKQEPFSAAVNAMLNTPFSDLPPNLKPVAKIGNRHLIAFWKDSSGQLRTFTKDLLNWGEGKEAGHWATQDGEKCELLDMNAESEGK